jgi:Domain of unknown function (DUF4386)
MSQHRSMASKERRVALVAGVFFIVTFAASIPAYLLYGPLLDHPGYIVGGGHDSQIQFGAFLEIVLVIANIATALVLFPVLKRYSESIALGYVAVRIVESTIIAIGIVSVLSAVTLRQDVGGPGAADAAGLVLTGRSLVAIHDWTFLLGPSFCAGLGNGLLLGYLMYRSGLVPRRMALLGLIGGPLCFAAATGVLFGVFGPDSAPKFLLTVPEIVWEASLGIYLIAKGFKSAPGSSSTSRGSRVDPTRTEAAPPRAHALPV